MKILLDLKNMPSVILSEAPQDVRGSKNNCCKNVGSWIRHVQVPFLSLLSCSLSASFLTYQITELLCSITVHLNELINEKHLERWQW